MFRDGRLCIGDRILEIDGNDVTQSTLAQATLALSALVPIIKVSVYREHSEGIYTP